MITAVLVVLLAQSHLDRAQALLREQKVTEARQELDRVLADDPDSVPALLLRGRIAMAENRSDIAQTAFTKAAGLAPQSAGAQFLLGFFYYVENDFARALPSLERARKITPEDARITLFLALTLDGLAQPDKAQALYEEALRLEAEAGRPAAETHVAYARMLSANGRLADAQVHVTKALGIDPASREAHYEQARLHFERGQFAESIVEGVKALGLAGTGISDRSIHFLLSRAYARAGNAERASFHRHSFESIPPRLVR